MSTEIPGKKNFMGGYEFDLPVELIQLIQSFLNRKELAQTAILSKSWFKALYTSPTLYLCEPDFPITGNDTVSTEFSNFATSTIQRYETLTNFVLIIGESSSLVNCAPLVNELIIHAIQLGLKSFHLLVKGKRYVLPAQVFAIESLTRLCVDWCEINGFLDGRVLCSRLTGLVLNFVYVNDEIVRSILLGCPLIENLNLIYCEGLTSVFVGKMRKLVTFDVRYEVEGCVELKDARIVGLGVPEFRYLRELEFLRVKLDKDFFSEFSSRFPCVENLSLELNPGSCENVKLSSSSLRFLNLVVWDMLKKMQFNVPNIEKFCLSAFDRIPLLSFGDVKSREWVSDIELEFTREVVEDSWFFELKKFLTELSGSRIDLIIQFNVEYTTSFERIPCFPMPVVETLAVYAESDVPFSLFCGIFWSCRPRYISFSKFDDSDPPLELLYKLLMQDNNKDLLRVYNLKEVNLELFEDDVIEWLDIPWEKLVDTLENPHNVKEIRFRYNWEQGDSPS